MIVVPSGSKTITARPAGSSNEADDLFTLTTDVGNGTIVADLCSQAASRSFRYAGTSDHAVMPQWQCANSCH
ncbi:MAG: hypothetical protein U0528_03210 [Anaerolineae bacterium]